MQSFIHRIPVVRGLFRRLLQPTFKYLHDPRPGQPIVVLIPGTSWWQCAHWTQKNSDFVRKMVEGLPGFGLAALEWSGANSADARKVAAEKLPPELERLKILYPTSPIMAVCHSHGGNILAWASTIITFHLDAAIYLNTPFVQVETPYPASTPGLKTLLVVLAGLMSLPLMSLFHLETVPAYALKRLIAVVTLLLAWAVLSIGLIMLVRRIKTREWLIDITIADRRIRKEMPCYAAGDEVNSMFGFVQALHWARDRGSLICTLGIFGNLALMVGRVLPLHIAELVHAGLLFSVGGLFILYLLAAVGAHGLEQGVLALDSPMSVTCAPVGESVMTVLPPGGVDQHSSIAHSPERIIPLIRNAIKKLNGV